MAFNAFYIILNGVYCVFVYIYLCAPMYAECLYTPNIAHSTPQTP